MQHNANINLLEESKIGMAQARVWELNKNVPRYELKELPPTLELNVEETMARAIKDILKKEHSLTPATRGELSGHF